MSQPKSPLDKARGYELNWPIVAPMFEATRVLDNPSYVYVIGEEDESAVKIGKATDPVARLRGMQTGNPRRLRIEFLLVGLVNTEKLLHEMWREYAVVAPAKRGKVDVSAGTEWFRAKIRPKLFPVMATAVDLQLEHIDKVRDPEVRHAVYVEDLEACIRRAHGLHGIVAKRKDETILLGQTVGYSVSRRSRL